MLVISELEEPSKDDVDENTEVPEVEATVEVDIETVEEVKIWVGTEAVEVENITDVLGKNGRFGVST